MNPLSPGVLNSVAMTYIEDNFKTLYKNDRILRLNWDSFHKILSSDRLNVENEDKVISTTFLTILASSVADRSQELFSS